MTRPRTRLWEIPRAQAEVVGANIRVLRQRNGWSQAHLGQLMGWPTTSTVCAAEGHRDGRQRGFTVDEVQRLAAIFGREPWQLTTRCANCEGHPPLGFTCETCGARSTPEQITVAQALPRASGTPAGGRPTASSPASMPRYLNAN